MFWSLALTPLISQYSKFISFVYTLLCTEKDHKDHKPKASQDFSYVLMSLIKRKLVLPAFYFRRFARFRFCSATITPDFLPSPVDNIDIVSLWKEPIPILPSLVPRQRFSLIIIDISFHESCEILLPVEQTNSSPRPPTPPPNRRRRRRKDQRFISFDNLGVSNSISFHGKGPVSYCFHVKRARLHFCEKGLKILCDKGLKTPFMRQGTQKSIYATRDSKLHLCDKGSRLDLCD